MLINLKQILDMAEEGGYAIPAFNVYNMETVMGIIRAAEEAKSPVIIQSYSRLFTNEEGYFVSPIVLAAAKRASVPVCFHLDHGAGKTEVIRALRYGASGIMIDNSNLPFDENKKATKEVVEMCDAVGIPVEGELGHIGSVNDAEMQEFTKVDEAVEFVDKTGVCALAILVGTAHGRYKKAPKLDIQRISDIHKATDAHLVLHGGSGVPDDQLKAAVDAGIRKINFGTDVCYSFLDKVFETSRDLVAIDLFMKDAIESVKEFALTKIDLLGARNRV
ncbi:MAG: class II fructose-bisphosphate aldolase [Clostridiales bacterium]|nr:class II fructose-bisphosphate aldolase [Clostridiales bacterium]